MFFYFFANKKILEIVFFDFFLYVRVETFWKAHAKYWRGGHPPISFKFPLKLGFLTENFFLPTSKKKFFLSFVEFFLIEMKTFRDLYSKADIFG